MSDELCDPTLTDCPLPCDPSQGSCTVETSTTTTITPVVAPQASVSKLPAPSTAAGVLTILGGVFYAAAGLLNLGYTTGYVNGVSTDATILAKA